MSDAFIRTGDLKNITSYPAWLQQVVADTADMKSRVVNHRLFTLMRDAQLPKENLRRFLTGVWPTIEQFPRFMSMNLQKAGYGNGRGEDMARAYLIQNIRVEQKHAQHWQTWAEAVDLSLDDLRHGNDVEGLSALANWCWFISDSASLAVGVAATNYAVEGATGEWSCLVCSRDLYRDSLPAEQQVRAMRWLRVHAEYDDTHPWEALDIVATLLGHQPPQEEIDRIRRAIRSSYRYMELALDAAMTAKQEDTTLEEAEAANDPLMPKTSVA